jgi:HTTM domain
MRLARIWQDFWHKPLRAETLGLTRVAFAVALLTDQFFQYLPNLSLFFGPEGVAPAGVNDGWAAHSWQWTMLFFHTDDMRIVSAAFALWMLATLALLVGWRTRWAAFLVWFGAICFLWRNPLLKNGGDDILRLVAFLMMISPCGDGLSLDARRRRLAGDGSSPYIRPWPVRLFQLQLCAMYLATGTAKLRGHTWWDGTSVHNVLNDVTLARWSYAQVPLPFWFTAALTWSTLLFEVGFPLFVLWKPTRKWVLIAGILFHLGIYVMIEVGWFSFYTIALYAAWVPSAWWEKRFPAAAGQPAAANPPG